MFHSRFLSSYCGNFDVSSYTHVTCQSYEIALSHVTISLKALSHVTILLKAMPHVTILLKDLSHVIMVNVACQIQEMAVSPCRVYGSRATLQAQLQRMTSGSIFGMYPQLELILLHHLSVYVCILPRLLPLTGKSPCRLSILRNAMLLVSY